MNKFFLSILLLAGLTGIAYAGIRNTPAPARLLQADVHEAVKITPSFAPRVMIGIPDTTLSPETNSFISKHAIGGILLLGRNVQSPEQLKKLTADIHAINPDIIVAVDQEGGGISRIRFSGSELTAQKNMENETDAYIIARRRAEELRSYGIDMNFSPVADFITDPDSFLYNRTFQKDPEEIAVLAGAMLRGYQDGGITPVLKHFPGHTNDSTDTHETVARIAVSEQELTPHLLPFKKIIFRFSPPAIMVGGSIYESLDSKPAALSEKIIKNLLREELGFSGMVITDDLEMDAFSQYSLADRARMAFAAGADMVIFSQTKTTQKELQAVISSLSF
jgi:beta-N-acetylhexosaminidase